MIHFSSYYSAIYPIPTFSPMAGTCATLLVGFFHKVYGSLSKHKGPCPSNSGDDIADCYFQSQRLEVKEASGHFCCTFYFFSSHASLTEVTFWKFKWSPSFHSPLHFPLFPLLSIKHWKWEYSKASAYMWKIRKWPHIFRKRAQKSPKET